MANRLNVGPIVPVDKGVYSSATTYSILNLVDDGTGQVYLSKKNNNLGNNLTNGEWWGRYTGPQGPQGVKGDTGTINLAGEYGTSENVGLHQKFLTEKMAGFEEVVQTQLITTPPATLNAQVGYYYCIGGNGVVVDTMTIQLPAIADYEESKAKNVSFFMIMGSAPAVTFVSAGTERIRYQKDFALEAERGYEVNALWNSHAWVIAAVEIEIPETRVVATVNVTNTSGTTLVLGDTSNISAVEIDGVEQQSVETGYTFSTTGEHTVKYTLTDPTSINNSTFSSCSDLTSVTIPDSVTSIGSFAFSDCTGLTSITIPNSVTSIDEGAFVQCTGLTSITIPNSVTNIGNEAFGACTSLTNITIGSGVTSIGDFAFSGCTGLTSIVVDSANTVYDSRDNCNAIIKTSTNELIAGCKTTVIPNTVTSIGNFAFNGCTGLTSIGGVGSGASVEIPNSVTSIDDGAFQSCIGLTSVIIPDSVSSIGKYAFYSCTSLTSITIPDSVTTIGESAFEQCPGLTNITIPDSVTSISKWAFGYCTGLKSITIPDRVTTIGGNAFHGCSGLTNITIPDSVTSIGSGAFSGCTGLTSITIPDSITSLDDETFEGCKGLTSITIPDNVTTIGDDAFRGCSGLTNITIPDSVTSIGEYAFYGCSGLTSITIPDRVTSIGGYVFEGCKGLTSITSLATTAPTIDSATFYNIKTGGTLYVPSGSTGYDTWMGTSDYYLGKYNWTNKVIPFFAKLSLNNGEVVELQGSGQLTYQMVSPNRSSLVSAEIGELCTSIGFQAFGWCDGLTSITIPNSVTSIGSSAFWSCDNLTSVTIGSGVTSIGDDAFGGCEGLTSIVVNSANTVYDSRDNCNAIVNTSTNELIAGCKNTVIPNTVTSIDDGAFQSCTGLTSITIPNSVTNIGNEAFGACTSLTNITIGNGVSSIGSQAFNNCKGLTSVTIPNSVTTIGSQAFNNCKGLTSVTIGSGVTSIGDSAFSGCTGLTNIVVDSANTVFDSRDNCNAIIKKSTNELIAGCKNTVIPNSVTNIGEEAFWNCSGLTSITIPDSVTNIGKEAFARCYDLTSVTIGSGVTNIGQQAFGWCTDLTSITCNATTAPTIDNSTFQNVKTGGTLRVPSGSTGYNVWMGTGNYYLGKYEWIIPFFAKLSLNNGEVVELQGNGELTQAMITPYKSSVVGAEFGNGVTSIGNLAFMDCTSLISVIIGNGVTSIGASAFNNCTSLTSVTIGNGVSSIGYRAFNNCKGLTSVTIPNSVTTIGEAAFIGCTGLTSVTIGNGVTSIGKYAFQDCSGLTSVTSNATTAPTIQNNTFYGVKTGGTLTVPSGSTGYNVWMGTGSNYLGKYNWTMVVSFFAKLSLDNGEVVELQDRGELTEAMVSQYKSSLVSAEIGNDVTSIGEWAFMGCTSLTSVTIGSGVTSISEYAFGDCANLTTITSLATTAPTIERDTFDRVKTGGTLRVPSGSTGYDEWMSYLDMYSWTMVEQ